MVSKEINVHYLSKNIQNEFIALLSSKENEKILSALQQAKYYSIVLDCTPDVSHKEQMTVVVCFIHAVSGEEKIIKEHFLGFVQVLDTSGEGLTVCLLDVLAKRGLPLKNTRGQGYNNGSNMKGKMPAFKKEYLTLTDGPFMSLVEATYLT